MPSVELGRIEGTRICIIHKNIPNMISQITTAMSSNNVNIDHMMNKSKKDYAYTVIDTNDKVTEAILDTINAVEGVIRVRTIKG